MKQIQGGVTAAKGFEAAGVEAAIKYQNRKDMALIVSKAPRTVAGTFTSNVVKAAPVLWDKQIVEHSAFAQAVVVNSGIANACTGKQGLDCCEAEAKCAGELLGVPTDAVLVASTGVIGMQIPVDKITAGIEKLVGQPFQRDATVRAAVLVGVHLTFAAHHQQLQLGQDKTAALAFGQLVGGA